MHLEDEDYDQPTYFFGCTCEHDPGEHDWGACDVDDCEGG